LANTLVLNGGFAGGVYAFTSCCLYDVLYVFAVDACAGHDVNVLAEELYGFA
jgi:hypothetical protein